MMGFLLQLMGTHLTSLYTLMVKHHQLNPLMMPQVFPLDTLSQLKEAMGGDEVVAMVGGQDHQHVIAVGQLGTWPPTALNPMKMPREGWRHHNKTNNNNNNNHNNNNKAPSASYLAMPQTSLRTMTPPSSSCRITGVWNIVMGPF